MPLAVSDAVCLANLPIDKAIRGLGQMQAIARVNRVLNRERPGRMPVSSG